jgi:peptidoglycan hydrolase-like protein with peptidoglycan-binding domain
LLKKGTKSDSVKWLQWELVQAGFNISIDGIFGLKTETAVRSFQKLYNLKVDGIVGSATRSMLKVK